MICENHWFRFNGSDHSLPLSELTTRVDCTKEATEVVHDDYLSRELRVCKECEKQIELVNWLHSPEGQAALEESDWEDYD